MFGTGLFAPIYQTLFPSRSHSDLQREESVRLPLAVQANADSFPIPKFWEPNFCEPSVQLPLKDFCKPGDVVFDVGANAGALTMLMSRLVGPRGIVCSFEASPRIIDKTHYNLVRAGCFNTQLFHRAVYAKSGEFLTLYAGTHLNDSLFSTFADNTAPTYRVETVALDDFCAASKLVPRVVKMDIEGAEFDALQGMHKTLEITKPVLILEQSPSDDRCLSLLSTIGYHAVDLATYRPIRGKDDFAAGVSVANLLFVHENEAGASPYHQAVPSVSVAQLRADAFSIGPSAIELREPAALPPGRYICHANFTAKGTTNEILAGIESQRGLIVQYHTYTAFMASSYRDWVFHLRTPEKISPYLRFVRGSDDTLQWRCATIESLPAFDDRHYLLE